MYIVSDYMAWVGKEETMCPVCEEEKETFNIAYWDTNVCIQNRLQGNSHSIMLNFKLFWEKDKVLCDMPCFFLLKRKVKLNITQHKPVYEYRHVA